MSDTAPATKADIKMLMNSIGELSQANEAWKSGIIHEFHIVAKEIQHDLGGAQSDRIAGVENRVTRPELHTGIVA